MNFLILQETFLGLGCLHCFFNSNSQNQITPTDDVLKEMDISKCNSLCANPINNEHC